MPVSGELTLLETTITVLLMELLMVFSRGHNAPTIYQKECVKLHIISFQSMTIDHKTSPPRPLGVLPYMALAGSCGHIRYGFPGFFGLEQDISVITFCLKQGINFSTFCLEYMKGILILPECSTFYNLSHTRKEITSNELT